MIDSSFRGGKKTRSDIVFTLCVALFLVVLYRLPTGFDGTILPNSETAVGRILEVDDSMVYTPGGIIRQGVQICTVEIASGRFKGHVLEGTNRYIGKLEMDKTFAVGDKALVAVDFTDAGPHSITLVDHYRGDMIALLAGLFALFLLLFAGWVGLKALLSFAVTVMVIWKVLIPCFLKGWNPVLVALAIILFLTVVIVTLVCGVNRKALAAVLGTFSGVALASILAITFSRLFKIHGAVLPFSETLLYSGYGYLDITGIFIASVYIACSGAMMDLAVDIAAALDEMRLNCPGISRRQLIRSGFSIGRAVVGTMTTTLLFAYSSIYLALLMIFMAQRTPVVNILNLRYISAEILHTLVGSFALVTVAPFTAIIGGFLLAERGPAASLSPDAE